MLEIVGKRETTGGREARAAKNALKAKAHNPRGMSPREIMLAQARATAKKKAEKALGELYANVMVAVSQEYYEGKVKYCAFRACDDKRGQEMHSAVEAAMKPFLDLPASEQTKNIKKQASEIVRVLNQGWIDCGWLIPEDIRIGSIPLGRIYDDGRVEAVSRAVDMDVVDMGRRMRTEIKRLKKG